MPGLSPSPVRRLPAASGGGGRQGGARAKSSSAVRTDSRTRLATDSAAAAPAGRGAAAAEEPLPNEGPAAAHPTVDDAKEASEHSDSAGSEDGGPADEDPAFVSFIKDTRLQVEAIHREQIDLLTACFVTDPNIVITLRPYLRLLEGSDSSADPLAKYDITRPSEAQVRTPVQQEKIRALQKLHERLSPATIAAVSAAFAESGQITAKVLAEINKLVAVTFRDSGFSLSQLLQGTTTYLLVDVFGIRPLSSARSAAVSTASMLSRHQTVTALTASIIPRQKSSLYVVLPPGGALDDFNQDTPYRVLLEPLSPDVQVPIRCFNDYTADKMIKENLVSPNLSYRLELLSWAHQIVFKIFQLLVANCTLPEIATKLRTLNAVYQQMEQDTRLHTHANQVPSAFDFLLVHLYKFGAAGTTAYLELTKALQRGTKTHDLAKVVAVLSFKIEHDQLLSQSAMHLLTLHNEASAAMGLDKFQFVPNDSQLLEIFRAAVDDLPIVGLPNQQVYAALLADLAQAKFKDMPGLMQHVLRLEETKQLSSIIPSTPAAQDGPSATFSAAAAAVTAAAPVPPAPATVMAADGVKKGRHRDRKKAQDKPAATASATTAVPPPPPPRPPAMVPPPPPPRPQAQPAASAPQQPARHQKKTPAAPNPASAPAPAAPQGRQPKPSVAEAFKEVTTHMAQNGTDINLYFAYFPAHGQTVLRATQPNQIVRVDTSSGYTSFLKLCLFVLSAHAKEFYAAYPQCVGHGAPVSGHGTFHVAKAVEQPPYVPPPMASYPLNYGGHYVVSAPPPPSGAFGYGVPPPGAGFYSGPPPPLALPPSSSGGLTPRSVSPTPSARDGTAPGQSPMPSYSPFVGAALGGGQQGPAFDKRLIKQIARDQAAQYARNAYQQGGLVPGGWDLSGRGGAHVPFGYGR